MAHIVPLIAQRMVETLQNYLSDVDPANIKVGRWLLDPTRAIVRAAVIPGNPEDASYRDGVVSLEQMDNTGIRIDYPREMGGGELWWRRFTTLLDCYWINDRLPEEEALDRSYMVYGALVAATRQMSIAYLNDDFGERVILGPVIAGSTMLQSGGDSQFIWRGKVFWQVLTGQE